MAESELHKRAKKLLHPGDFVGQPIGDPFQIAKLHPKAAYDGDNYTKRLQADLAVETTDGQTVHIEFEVANHITADKLERLQEAGVFRVLSIELLPECRDYSDDELRKYIAQGNVFLKTQSHAQTHKWRDLPDSNEPSDRLAAWRAASEELAKHSCFIADCDKPVTSALESALHESDDRELRGIRRRKPKPTRMLPIYSCQEHVIVASLRQLPEGAEKGWVKPLREHYAERQPELTSKRIPNPENE